MKKVIKLILFLLIIIISTVFYKIYFVKKITPENQTVIENDIKETTNIDTQNNLIKNLKYEVKLDQDNEYIITSDLSEITYQNNVETVKMNKVMALFIDKTNLPIKITSDKAIYNNSNYNTQFSQNVRIEYLDNVILSDSIELNFTENIIKINQNVKYNGSYGSIFADNININLITKKIEIYMENKSDNVEIYTKK